MAKPASGTPLDTGNALYTSTIAVYGMLEGSGTSSTDSVAGTHNLGLATAGSGVTWTTVSGDAALAFAGCSTVAATIAMPFTLAGSSSWSVAWRGKQTTNNSNGVFAGNELNGGDVSFLFWSGGAQFRFRSAAHTDYDWTGITNFTAEHNYLLVYDQPGAKLHFYVDGVQDGTGLTVTANDAALSLRSLGSGVDGSGTLALVGDLLYFYVWSGRALNGTDAGTLNTIPYGMFGTTASAVITEQNLPANHLGNITVHVVGTGTSFTSSTTWTPSGVAGWSVASKTQVDGTHYTVVLTPPTAATPPAGAVGTLTLTEGVTGTVAATTTVGTPSFTRSPTSGLTGSTPTLTLTGTNTIWSSETAAGLFTVTGGTGASLATPTVTTDTAATDVLTVGSAAGTLTITDTSTGATVTFTANAGTIAIVAPVQYQWKRHSSGSASFTVSGTYTGSPSTVEVSTNGGSTWATLDAAPSAGNYTGTVSLATSLADYTIQVRFSADHSVTASVANIAVVNRVIAVGGQSNEAGRLVSNQTAFPVFGADASRKKTATGYAVLADPTGTDGSAAGSYVLDEANILGAALGQRIGIVNFAVGGTSIAQWQKGSGSGYYEALSAQVDLVGGFADIVRMGPCEDDAIAGTSTSTYHAGISSWVTSWNADHPGSKYGWRTLQHINPAQATQPHQDNINAGVTQAAGTVNGVAGGDIANVYLVEVRSVPAYPTDDFHWLTDDQGAVVGGIAAAADYAALNPSTNSGGGANLTGNGTLVVA